MVSTLMIVASFPAEAVKILLDKPMLFSEEGDFVGRQSLKPEVLGSMGFVTIATYPTFLAGEVQEEDLADFYTAAEENAVNYEIRRDYDLIQVNGYSFSSFISTATRTWPTFKTFSAIWCHSRSIFVVSPTLPVHAST